MTLPSLRKLRITRRSIHRRTRTERPLGIPFACFALAGLLLTTGPYSGQSAEAGKRRREASIERLRERNPAERWKSLQKLWRPPEVSSESTPRSPDGPAREPIPAPAVETGEESSRPASTASGVSPVMAPPTSGYSEILLPADTFASPEADSGMETDRPLLAVPSAPRRVARYEDEPGVLPGVTEAESPGVPLPGSASPESGIPADEARPKPITQIMPYYDYSPDGTSPCEFLCPKPPDCQDEDDAEPCPEIVALPHVPFEGRLFVDTHVTWAASNLFSNPLYFEDAALERYGHTHHHLLQPLVSLGKFSAQLVGLPYQMALHPIHERRYALGWYRPGECAPHKYYLPPWNTKAALTAGAVYTGLFYVIP